MPYSFNLSSFHAHAESFHSFLHSTTLADDDIVDDDMASVHKSDDLGDTNTNERDKLISSH